MIQAQGSCKDKFARRDFPKLLELVKNICEFNNVCNDGSGNPSTSTDTQQTVQNVENNNTQQTVQNVDDESGNPSTSTDTQQTTKCRRWVRESKYKHRHTTNCTKCRR